MLLVSGALAQSTAGTATVQNVTVGRDSSGLRVEVTLSSPVQPSIETAVNPDRILLDFPGTITNGNTQKEVNTDGVRRVRTGQHSVAPPVTRVVLDLDQARSYTTRAEGNRIIITVGAALSTKADRSAGPASPMSLGISGIFRRKPAAPQFWLMQMGTTRLLSRSVQIVKCRLIKTIHCCWSARIICSCKWKAHRRRLKHCLGVRRPPVSARS